MEAQEYLELTTPAPDVETFYRIVSQTHDSKALVAIVSKPGPENPVFDKHGKPKAFAGVALIPAGELTSYFPQLNPYYPRGCYFSVNQYSEYTPTWTNKTTGLPDGKRTEKWLKWLAYCYTDIDCGRPDSNEPGAALNSYQAMAKVLELADAGVIPIPFIFAHSGRGLHLWWRLKNERAPAWKIVEYKKCNRALGERLRENGLPADRGAIDAAKVLPFPGTIKSKNGREVLYQFSATNPGRRPGGFELLEYTLRQMADFLGLLAPGGELPENIRALPGRKLNLHPGTAPKRKNGKVKLNENRAKDIFTLQAHRGGFKKHGGGYPDGHTSKGRHFILSLYLETLKLAGTPKEEAAAALADMAKNCRPPYPSDPPGEDPPLEEILREVWTAKLPLYGYYNRLLCKLLGVTADLADELGLLTIRPETHKPKQTIGEIREDVETRRDVARQEEARLGKALSARKLEQIYKERGIKGANRQTANEDLRANGFYDRYPPGNKGRPRKDIYDPDAEPYLPGLEPPAPDADARRQARVAEAFKAHVKRDPAPETPYGGSSSTYYYFMDFTISDRPTFIEFPEDSTPDMRQSCAKDKSGFWLQKAPADPSPEAPETPEAR